MRERERANFIEKMGNFVKGGCGKIMLGKQMENVNFVANDISSWMRQREEDGPYMFLSMVYFLLG